MTTTIATHTEAVPSGAGKLFLKASTSAYGDFRDDLLREGFVVIKGATPRGRADQYAEKMYKFLEDL